MQTRTELDKSLKQEQRGEEEGGEEEKGLGARGREERKRNKANTKRTSRGVGRCGGLNPVWVWGAHGLLGARWLVTLVVTGFTPHTGTVVL